MSRIVHNATVGPQRPGRCPWWWRVDDRVHGRDNERWIERTRLARLWCRYVDRRLAQDEAEHGWRHRSHVGLHAADRYTDRYNAAVIEVLMDEDP